MIPEKLSEDVKSLLREHEGWSSTVYRCPSGRLTIGYGRNLEDRGIRRIEGEILLDHDVVDVYWSLAVGLHEWGIEFHRLPHTIQVVLMDMCYNLGLAGLFQFRKMLAAVRDQDWQRMAAEMQDSRWYQQTGRRARKLVQMVHGVKS